MNVSVSRVSQANASDAVLVDLFEELATKLQAGEPVDLDAYARAHPELAEPLRRLLPTIHVLADLGRSAAKGDPSAAAVAAPAELERGVLGDFRIFHEIGRGGMGIVYEAEQISLGRRVALKVLPFAAAMDPKQLQRFKNEAQAAAHLQHTNIVPVFYVGCERGVHFYAMQYIEGQTLAQVIADLRLQNADLPKRKSSPEGQQPPLATQDQQPVPQSAIGNRRSAITPTPPVAALSTEHSTTSPAFGKRRKPMRPRNSWKATSTLNA